MARRTFVGPQDVGQTTMPPGRSGQESMKVRKALDGQEGAGGSGGC